MMGIRSQSININRMVLIEKLREGLVAHESEYQEAMTDYNSAVVKFMREACTRAESGDFDDLVLKFPKPVSHSDDYKNVIELLTYSVDENINLDSESFRSYVKGEWSWRGMFDMSKTLISGYLGK